MRNNYPVKLSITHDAAPDTPQRVYQLAADEFFDYEMQHVKGQKMPRADKSEVLNYLVYVPSIEIQQSTLNKVREIHDEITAQNGQLQELTLQKDDILKKYLSSVP